MVILSCICCVICNRWHEINKAWWSSHRPCMRVDSSDEALRWRHNGRDSDCLLNGLFMRRSKKTWKLRVTGLCAGNSPGTGESPHKWPVTRKMFPFDDVIMECYGNFEYHICVTFIKSWPPYQYKNGLSRNVDFHNNYNGNHFTDETACLYWNSPWFFFIQLHTRARVKSLV